MSWVKVDDQFLKKGVLLVADGIGGAALQGVYSFTGWGKGGTERAFTQGIETSWGGRCDAIDQ